MTKKSKFGTAIRKGLASFALISTFAFISVPFMNTGFSAAYYDLDVEKNDKPESMSKEENETPFNELKELEQIVDFTESDAPNAKLRCYSICPSTRLNLLKNNDLNRLLASYRD